MTELREKQRNDTPQKNGVPISHPENNVKFSLTIRDRDEIRHFSTEDHSLINTKMESEINSSENAVVEIQFTSTPNNDEILPFKTNILLDKIMKKTAPIPGRPLVIMKPPKSKPAEIDFKNTNINLKEPFKIQKMNK